MGCCSESCNCSSRSAKYDLATTIVDTILLDLINGSYSQEAISHFLTLRQKWIDVVMDGGRDDLAIAARRAALNAVLVDD